MTFDPNKKDIVSWKSESPFAISGYLVILVVMITVQKSIIFNLLSPTMFGMIGLLKREAFILN